MTLTKFLSLNITQTFLSNCKINNYLMPKYTLDVYCHNLRISFLPVIWASVLNSVYLSKMTIEPKHSSMNIPFVVIAGHCEKILMHSYFDSFLHACILKSSLNSWALSLTHSLPFYQHIIKFLIFICKRVLFCTSSFSQFTYSFTISITFYLEYFSIRTDTTMCKWAIMFNHRAT